MTEQNQGEEQEDSWNFSVGKFLYPEHAPYPLDINFGRDDHTPDRIRDYIVERYRSDSPELPSEDVSTGNLPFEKFLDPERPTSPDIDQNFVDGGNVHTRNAEWLNKAIGTNHFFR
jgi:hypothetical protein